LRALRYPDRSVVIDLSHQPQAEKNDYIRAVLPALNAIRIQTGLPHRIFVDEAHYFLHDAGARHLIDLERNGYTLVTYWASRLPEELLAAAEVMIVTRESNPREIEALRRWCPRCSEVEDSRWAQLEHVRSGQAVALPVTAEAAGTLQLFTLAPRVTPHVRHKEKYVDVPVSEHRAFVFAANGQPSAQRVRTLREFVSVLERAPVKHFEDYLRRGDFSRWIGEVFGDYPLATKLRTLEAQHSSLRSDDTVPEIVAAIRARYDVCVDDTLNSANGR
jgi:hypothetical protein